jgi:AcrR family transcriptional regulator
MERGRAMRKKNQEITKRKDILLAAEHVFAERGFKGTTVRAVAQKAGIANSLIFYYFKNKLFLYEAVFQSFFEQLEDLILQHLNLDLDRLGILKELLFAVTDFSARHRNLLIILTREIIDNGNLVQQINQKYFRPLYDTAAGFLAEGSKEALFRNVDPLHFLQTLMGMNIFYFISDPLLQAVGVRDPYGSQEIEKRKTEVWNIVRSSLT